MARGRHKNYSFANIPQVRVPRSVFDRSHQHKTTFDRGRLIPIFVDEALPGDTFNVRLNCVIRIATLLHPIMDNIWFDTHFFFVPYRLVWDNFQKFMGEQENPGDSIDYMVPQIDWTGLPGEQSIYDYCGIPTTTAGLTKVSALPFRAMALIWNEWYRDENLQNSTAMSKDDGPDDMADYYVYRRGKRHDYFTSSLPWPSKGPDVLIPLGTTAPVVSEGDGVPTFDPTGGGGGPTAKMQVSGQPVTIDQTWVNPINDVTWADPKLEADLSSASAASVNQWREAITAQQFYERDARGGTRYTELVRSHFGVSSPDSRLQRPEYLGGGTSPLRVNQVTQTSRTDTGESPQGNLAAYGVSQFGGHGFMKSFVEHGVVIGFISVRADLTYQQGLNKMWSREDRFDFYWPTFAHLGEQEVTNREIKAVGTTVDDETFGYQERYAEYRYKQSMVTGKFRSSAAQSLDTWHLAQDFTGAVTLGAAFIQEDPPINRIVAVSTEPEFLFDGHFTFKAARPMPVYSVPGLRRL